MDSNAPEPAPDDKTLIESCLKAADGHRQRLTTLHQNEWQIAIVFWSAFAGGTVLGVSNADRLMPLPLGALLVVALAYGTAGLAYLFGFCRTNYASLTTERRRYLYFQNMAFRSLPLGAQSLLAEKGGAAPVDGTAPTGRLAYRQSEVWQFKALSTSLLLGSSLTILTYVTLSKTLAATPWTLCQWLHLAEGGAILLLAMTAIVRAAIPVLKASTKP